jgi:hypothetical protein
MPAAWAADESLMKFTRRLSLITLAIAVVALASLAPGRAEALTVQSQAFQMSGANDSDRLTVACPGSTLPYSGGMQSEPPGIGGTGVYPHSFERLGVQGGWHVSPVLFSPVAVLPGLLSAAQATGTHSVTLQVICGPRLGPVSSPHSTVFVSPGQSKTAIATCPPGNRIFAGGFQRTDFVGNAGDYITESRAASDRSWQVSASAFGAYGGELTAIAYCVQARSPVVSEIAADSPLPVLKSGTATTPACPPGSSLVGGGFTTSPSGPALISSAYLNPDGSWSTTAFNLFGPAATLGARGYCMSAATIKRLHRKRHGTRGPGERSVVAPPLLDRALKVAIQERVTANGCYPAPAAMAGTLRSSGIPADTATGPRQVGRPGVVYVLSDSSCERARLAMRQARSVIVLDSATGQVIKRSIR